MFSWLEGLVSSIASSIGGVFEGIGDTIVNAIWDNLVKWLFNASLRLHRGRVHSDGRLWERRFST